VRLGATLVGEQQTQFVVWAPHCKTVSIRIIAPQQTCVELTQGEQHYFTGTAAVGSGARYLVVTDTSAARPDPASRCQPDGVHGPSEVLDPSFNWTDDDWRGVELPDYIIYELHIGTFTDAGTFDAAIAHLDELKQLGVTAIEIMPVAQFPGHRNWGYDGVFPYAVHDTYGGPAALKRLVNAAHARGLAVILDVVYNHIGPEGNYLGEFGPYFTETYKTAWGQAVNVDGAHSDEVRRYFIENALEWITDYHFDALRLDAVHSILDTSAQPFLAELAQVVNERARQLGRHVYLIAESDLNDVRMIAPVPRGGMGMHAQWTDDFHHALHALLTGEETGYYVDYGSVAELATSFRRGYVFTGQYSKYRLRRHGNEPAGAHDEQFVICLQNHDQVGNRMLGDRIASIVDFERQKLGAAVMLLSPFVPMLFMGEEYAELRPFPYFIDHSDDKLKAAVSHGRKHEFAAFAWRGEPSAADDPATFESAKLRRVFEGRHRCMRDYYQRLIELRQSHGLARGALAARVVIAHEKEEALSVVGEDVCMVFSFTEQPQTIRVPLPSGQWQTVLASRAQQWGGPGGEDADLEGSPAVALRLAGVGALLFTRVS
jgi:maltooligosyltrehalose trehalohydrolase